MSLHYDVPSPAAQRHPMHEQVDAFYGRLFGWPLKWRGLQPYLVLENGICAVTLPEAAAAPVLLRLAVIGCAGPAMAMSTHLGRRVALLADSDGMIPARSEVPPDIEVMAWGMLLPLPEGTKLGKNRTEWLVAPDPRERWLPSLNAVFAGLHP